MMVDIYIWTIDEDTGEYTQQVHESIGHRVAEARCRELNQLFGNEQMGFMTIAGSRLFEVVPMQERLC